MIRKFTLGAVKAMFGSPKYTVPARLKPKFSIKDFKAKMDEIGEQNAAEFLELLLENINTNKFGFRLQPSTIKRKGSDIPWIETEELVGAIVQKGTLVGFKKGKHKRSGLSYEQLAIVLEYGVKDRGIPPRDVFRRTFAEFKPKAEQNLKNAFR